jgi:Family of unknown function (DUF6064)
MPFTVEQFFDLFARYNQALWPWQLLALAAGLVVVALLCLETRTSAAVTLAILSAMWLVNGVGYHWLYFATINPAARVFAAVFVLQALVFAGAIVLWPDIRFRVTSGAASIFGAACIVYAVAVYPALGWLAGHRYPAMPMFGVAPCPTTLFTIGVLLQSPWSAARWLVAIPALWAAIGASASFLLGVPQDYALFVALAGVVALALRPLWGAARP